jgi:hypothetical protein
VLDAPKPRLFKMNAHYLYAFCLLFFFLKYIHTFFSLILFDIVILDIVLCQLLPRFLRIMYAADKRD